MATVDSQITSAATTISENITELAGNRELMSKNIIKQLRDLTEGVIVRLHTKSGSTAYDHDARAGTAWIGSSGKPPVEFENAFYAVQADRELLVGIK